MADKKETAFPGAQELLLLIENLQDALLKVEWVCMGTNPRRFACAFCGGVSIKDGGDDHADDCEWCRLVRITPSEALGVSSQQERSGWQPISTAPEGTMALFCSMKALEVPKWCWVDWVAGGKLNLHATWEPTHWMPLPSPPLPVSVSGTPEQDKGR
jgi:hypothetical protein